VIRDYLVGPLPVGKDTQLKPLKEIYHTEDGEIPWNARGFLNGNDFNMLWASQTPKLREAMEVCVVPLLSRSSYTHFVSRTCSTLLFLVFKVTLSLPEDLVPFPSMALFVACGFLGEEMSPVHGCILSTFSNTSMSAARIRHNGVFSRLCTTGKYLAA